MLMFGMLSPGIGVDGGNNGAGTCESIAGVWEPIVPGTAGPGVVGPDPPVAVNSETMFNLRVALSSV